MLKKFEKYQTKTGLPKPLVDLRITTNGIDIILVDEKGGCVANLYSTNSGSFGWCEGQLELEGYDTSWGIWDEQGAFVRFSGDK